MSDPKIPGGYYIKSRKIQKSAIMNKPPCVREIWDYLLMNANHKDSILKGGKRIKRGQLLRRYDKIRDDLSWLVGWRKEMYDENQVKKAMKFLRESLMIASTKEPGGVLITILNYDIYQDPKNYERTNEGTEERTIEEPLKNQSVPTYDKNEEELKEEEIEEGETYDQPGYDNHVPLSNPYSDSYCQYMQSDSKKDKDGYNIASVVNGNVGDNDNEPACEANLNGGILNGSDMAIPGPGHNDNIHAGDNRVGVGNSGTICSGGGQAPMGPESAQLDREEVGRVGGNYAGGHGSVDTGRNGLSNIGGGVNDDILGTPEKDEAKPPKKAKEKNGIPYQEIVELLNEHAGKNFRHTAKQTQALIRARWRDGYTIDDFRRVIIGRVEKWSGDPKMCEYLRPPTLFGGKFESYLQADPVIKKVNLPKNKNKIKCKECANFGTCQNAEDDPIASCSLYTYKKEAVAA